MASATLAILLVCFSIYQYGNLDPEVSAPKGQTRLPPLPKAVRPGSTSDTPVRPVTVGSTPIGSGRNVKLTIYAPEGTRARFEIAVNSYSPIEGTVNEFLLVDPEVRLRTNSGNAVRVTAQQGIIEAQSLSGGSMAPVRGRLSGDVLIEIDRLSEQERKRLPEPHRHNPAPHEILVIRMAEMQFDRELSKLTVPGVLELSGNDVDFTANDLEVRFDQGDDRVQFLHIAHGGRIELRDVAQAFRLTTPSLDDEPRQRTGVVQWLKETLEAKMAAATSPVAHAPGSSAPTQPTADPEVPVFGAGDSDSKSPSDESPTTYYARFEDSVIATQGTGAATEAKLETAVLEVWRRVVDDDQPQVTNKGTGSGSLPAQLQNDAPGPPSENRVVLEWAGQLRVQTASPTDLEGSGTRSRIVASGNPVHVTSSDGEARCSKLTYEPDISRVMLAANQNTKVVVRATEQGMLEGAHVTYNRTDDRLSIHVDGPGIFRHTPERIGPGKGQTENDDDVTIHFTNHLDLDGRYVTSTRIDLAGGLVRQTYRRLDKAVFDGEVQVRQDASRFAANEMEVRFGSTGDAGRQGIEHVVARGDVVIADQDIRLTGGEVDLDLVSDAFGKILPLAVTARTNVIANRGDLALTAGDRLIIDFDTVSRTENPGISTPMVSAAKGHFLELRNSQDGPKKRVRTNANPSRIRAYGNVTVLDPARSLDVASEELDCTLRNGGEMETALLRGNDAKPATAQLRALTVSGREVTLHVIDEWAEVPGPGRLTFRSPKDLDGKPQDNPVPIVVTWTMRMKYQGRENRASFVGGVHATSATTRTFDGERIDLEFEDIVSQSRSWPTLGRLLDRVVLRSSPNTENSAMGTNKQLAALMATGSVVAVTSEFSKDEQQLETRASIRGPRLSLNLRDNASKMTIEGPGNLFLEDFRQSEGEPKPDAGPANTLFGQTKDAGPSKTIIQWNELMWYDYSIQQTRFEGSVAFTHISGSELARLVRMPEVDALTSSGGMRTFLTCDVLTADFQDRTESGSADSSPRMGRLGAERLRQFHARGNVSLEAPSHHLSLNADTVTFEKDRSLLAVFGSSLRKARILIRKPREYPQDLTGERFFYNLEANSVELAEPAFKRR